MNSNPRTVRNFWIETQADGVNTVQATGPRSKDGGFRTTIAMRNNGQVATAVEINGYVRTDGTLVLLIDTDNLDTATPIVFERKNKGNLIGTTTR
jgi:hypothetical protein